MSKIDELLNIARDNSGRLATLEQWVKDKESRCTNHAERLSVVEVNLNGDKTQEGLNEWKRNFVKDFKKRHEIFSWVIPSGMIIGWEITKRKLMGHW